MSPWAPKRPCTHPGCDSLTVDGKCDKHKVQEQNDYEARRCDDPFQDFYTSPAWRAVRADHLKIEPLCRSCAKEGQTTAAEMVDHIVPMKNGGAPFDHSNLQSLCNSHHSAKSILEGTRYGSRGVGPVRSLAERS